MRRPLMHSIWLVLLLSVFSSSVHAGTLGDLTYEIADGQVEITNCDEAAEGELVIPAEIEDLPVTSIGDWAFRDCSSLTSMTIPLTFYSSFDANRLGTSKLWPSGFRLPPDDPQLSIDISKTSLAGISIQIPIITVNGEAGVEGIIEFSETPNGPWTEWRTVVIGEDGTTEVDLEEGAEKRFYRIRN